MSASRLVMMPMKHSTHRCRQAEQGLRVVNIHAATVANTTTCRQKMLLKPRVRKGEIFDIVNLDQ